MMHHVMLDLETLDNTPTAAIVSIGAVVMDFVKHQTTDEIYLIIDPVSSQAAGLTIGASTVRWWLQQSPEAQAMFRSPDEKVLDLPQALHEFSRWLTAFITDRPAIWGNGATFDNVILRNAYRACNLMAPWNYQHDFCYRTMYRNFGSKEKYKVEGTRHSAIDDARSQAKALIEIMKRLNKS